VEWLLDAIARTLPALVLGAAAAAVVGAVTWRRRRRRGMAAWAAALGNVALTFSVVVILTATVSPRSAHGSVTLVPLQRTLETLPTPWKALRFVGGNVALFVPFGVALALRLPGLGLVRWAGLGVLLSVWVEATQFLVVPGRSTEVDDVLLNTLGTAVGGACVLAWRVVSGRLGGRGPDVAVPERPS
jgi:VanZ family protein